jgi:alkylation response protein AidB-like acyl-CoA dehydrogenase
MTEPNAGTDVPNYTTNTAVNGDRFTVNGRKTLISRADLAEMFVVFTRVDSVPGAAGIGCVLIPGGTRGLVAEAKYHTMGGEYLSGGAVQRCRVAARESGHPRPWTCTDGRA